MSTNNGETMLLEALMQGDYDYARLRCHNVYSVQDYVFCLFGGARLKYESAERMSEIATCILILKRLEAVCGADFSDTIRKLFELAKDEPDGTQSQEQAQ